MPDTQKSATFQINDTTANPVPLGLLGFGMTTVLLNLRTADSKTIAHSLS